MKKWKNGKKNERISMQMIICSESLGAVHTHTHTHTHTQVIYKSGWKKFNLVNKKINNINMHNQTGILCLYEDTG